MPQPKDKGGRQAVGNVQHSWRRRADRGGGSSVRIPLLDKPRFQGASKMPPPRTPTRKRRAILKPGACFKASRVECERDRTGAIEVKAEDVVRVVGRDEALTEPCVNMDIKYIRRNPSSFERRKFYTASSFKIESHREHLGVTVSENGTRIVDVQRGPLEARRFPPMRFVDGIGYRETNAVEAVFGLDPSIGRPWVTPVALGFIKLVWAQVIQAGGVFVADFDESESGWAVFDTMYICPAPSKPIYTQACRVKPKTFGGTSDRVAKPLRLCGGRVFKPGFVPTKTDLEDPVVFSPMQIILGDIV